MHITEHRTKKTIRNNPVALAKWCCRVAVVAKGAEIALLQLVVPVAVASIKVPGVILWRRLTEGCLKYCVQNSDITITFETDY